jgi:predicted GIY-YIG superfamily endonuclease
MTTTTTTTTTPTTTTTTNTSPTTGTATTTSTPEEIPRWTRLNYKGPLFHDNRRLLKHRAKNCECFVCYREIYKLPPAETHQEYVATVKTKIQERDIKRARKKAKKEVKMGKQSTINTFFRSFDL